MPSVVLAYRMLSCGLAMSFNPMKFFLAGSAKIFGSSFANNEFASWDRRRKVEVFDLVMHSSYMTSRFWQVSFIDEYLRMHWNVFYVMKY